LAIALFIPIFIVALFQARKDSLNKKEHAALDAEQIVTEILPTEGEWLESKAKFKALQWISAALFIVLILAAAYLVFTLKDKLTFDIILLMMFVPFIFLIMLPIRTLSQLKIGFFADHLTIETAKGRLISSPYRDIKWHKRAFVIDEWVVPIGNPAQSIFPYERLTELLMPRVLESNKLREVALMKLQWHSPDGTLKMTSLALFLGVIMMLILERESVLSFLSSYLSA